MSKKGRIYSKKRLSSLKAKIFEKNNKTFKKGIEKTSLYLIPVLFFIFILLSIRSITLDGAEKGIHFLLHLDKHYLGFTENGFQWMTLFETITAALGQAFISLSLAIFSVYENITSYVLMEE